MGSAAERVEVDAVLSSGPLERLREMGAALGNEVPRRIIELYLGDTPSRLQQMRLATAAGDVKRLESAVHSLKGSSANLGAEAVAEICRDLEMRCGDGLPEDTSSKLDALEAEVAKVEAAMQLVLRQLDD